MKIINDRIALDMIHVMDDVNILYDVEVRKMLVLETVQAYKRNLERAENLKEYNDILSDFRNMLVDVIEAKKGTKKKKKKIKLSLVYMYHICYNRYIERER